MKMAYCDYIAHFISKAINEEKDHDVWILAKRINYDLHPYKGWLMSTRKIIDVIDVNDKKYRIIVEELD